MNKICALTIIGAILLAPSLSFACKGSQVVFEDKFATLFPPFATLTNPGSIKDGKLVLQIKTNGGTQSAQYQSDFFDNDVDICTQINLAAANDMSGSTSWGAGIEFWAKDYTNFYLFWISPNQGKFAVYHYVGGRWAVPIQPQDNAAVKKGIGQPNHLRVALKGNQATFYINDQQVAVSQGQPPAGGSFFGLYGEAPEKSSATWEFSEFKVTK